MKTLKDIKFTTIPQYLQRRMIRKEAIKLIKEEKWLKGQSINIYDFMDWLDLEESDIK